jgi:prophage maintenance system killer protein
LLNQYDKGELQITGVSKKEGPALNYESLKTAIAKFKERLATKKEAGSLFGEEVGSKFKAVLGNINQTFGGKQLYSSLEEKAAHLLYFLIKDHPFADGNKRIGSLTFLLYLVENNFLYDKKGERKINDNTLTALALLIAESDPKDKEVMVRLVVNLIK